ncbi:positive regulation of toll-like receptor 2 signaling pathway [Tieghemiomyces parasiticus]|uniref:Positive regulation of toll-like receptor 2 signaling pathway n=1 Tax=Tieghemiomyces parasiticus TaxID=78921 RepID=A0A9W7ZV17_9FUNG|nr:positive regulation of toll-like receptor 2 signaling pathway [Tieghemiomyces parasiticus]
MERTSVPTTPSESASPRETPSIGDSDHEPRPQMVQVASETTSPHAGALEEQGSAPDNATPSPPATNTSSPPPPPPFMFFVNLPVPAAFIRNSTRLAPTGHGPTPLTEPESSPDAASDRSPGVQAAGPAPPGTPPSAADNGSTAGGEDTSPRPVPHMTFFFQDPRILQFLPFMLGVPPQTFFNQPFFNSEAQTIRGQPPASKAAIHDLPVLTANDLQQLRAATESGSDTLTCLICQDDLDRTETDGPSSSNGDASLTALRRMPCQHVFHETCLFSWLAVSNTCPTCRYEIMTDNSDYNRSVERRMQERDAAAAAAAAQRPKQPAGTTAAPTPSTACCAFQTSGLCECTRSDGNGMEGVEALAPSTVTLPRCNHSFHSTCLRTNLRARGFHPYSTRSRTARTTTSVDTESIGVPLRCPACRAPNVVPGEVLDSLLADPPVSTANTATTAAPVDHAPSPLFFDPADLD